MKIHETRAHLQGETLFETRVPTDLEIKTPLAIRIGSELLARGLIDEGDREKIEIAFEEAIKNAMVHGNRENQDLAVTVRVFCDGEGWGVTVQDQGEGFSENMIVDAGHPEFPWRDHERGSHLMRHLMDSVQYFCGGRQVVLLRKRSGA